MAHTIHAQDIDELGNAAVRQRVILAAALIVATALAAVFIVPWLVPTPIAPVQSDSQALGFYNRVAMLALAAGAASLFALALYAGRRGVVEVQSALASARSASADQRVNRWLVRAAIFLTLLMIVVVSALTKDHPLGDALYFTDRVLRVAAGGAPFSQIEFSYGPVLVYLPLLSWRALQWTGLSIYAVYYCWVAAVQAIGLALGAFYLNHVQMSRSLRNATFLVIAGFALLQPTLGLNYTPLRYLLPFVLFVWVIKSLTVEQPGGAIRSLVPFLAVAVMWSVSPEMAVALLVALVVALILLVLRGPLRPVAELVVLLIGVGAIVTAASSAGFGTFGAFAGGAYYFPVVPGLPALVFVGTVLVVAWATGSSASSATADECALQVGLLALAVVLIAPAFGRADFGHVFWNGLGVIALAVAVVDLKWHRARTYLAVLAIVFVGTAAIYAVMSFSDPLVDESLRTAAQVKAASTEDQATASRLAVVPALAFPEFLDGEIGTSLAQRGHLLPLYATPITISEADFMKLAGQLGAAQAMALPTDTFASYQKVASGVIPDSNGLVMSVPVNLGSPQAYAVLLGVPLELKARYKMFDPAASFGVLLQRDWRVDDVYGGYTVLKRR
jgi:hypothetical protein